GHSYNHSEGVPQHHHTPTADRLHDSNIPQVSSSANRSKGLSDLRHDSRNDGYRHRYITAAHRSRAAEKQGPPSIRSEDGGVTEGGHRRRTDPSSRGRPVSRAGEREIPPARGQQAADRTRGKD
ncbi:hypothetical protein C7212DRAFT_307589, partial [Tuber magnatum]